MHFLEISDISIEQLEAIFSLTRKLAKDSLYPLLKDKTCVSFFPDSSIRTRITFELAIKNLSGTTILFPSTTLDKSENCKDVIGYIQNWADLCIIRYSNIEVLKEIARYSAIPIINAMTSENHPCEIISDLYSINERFGSFKDKVFTFIGMPGNILNTWVQAARHFGFMLNHVSLKEFEIAEMGNFYNFSTDIRDFISSTDVLLTDGIPESFRNDEYYKNYQINSLMLAKAKDTIIVNPCPPFQRGEEIASEILDSNYFVGYSFKKPLLHVQQAIIIHCLEN